MEESPLDLDLLATHLRNEIAARALSVRAAAEKIGCSAATLSRLLQGAQAPNTPDSVNLLRAAAWLNKSLADFQRSPVRRTASLADVEVHLRALPGLSRADAEGLVAMVKAAYGAAAELRTKKGSGR